MPVVGARSTRLSLTMCSSETQAEDMYRQRIMIPCVKTVSSAILIFKATNSASNIDYRRL